MTRKIEVVKETFTRGSQDLDAERIVRVRSLQLRAEVKRDSYDAQCFARVSAWTNDGWKVVTTIPLEETRSRVASAYKQDPMPEWRDLSRQDMDTLIGLACDILLGPERVRS